MGGKKSEILESVRTQIFHFGGEEGFPKSLELGWTPMEKL